MSDHDFFFALRLADGGGSDEMLTDLTASVLRHVGYTPAVLATLADEIRAGVARGRADGGEYDLQFQVQHGRLDIVVSRGGRPIFSTSRQLP